MAFSDYVLEWLGYGSPAERENDKMIAATRKRALQPAGDVMSTAPSNEERTVAIKDFFTKLAAGQKPNIALPQKDLRKQYPGVDPDLTLDENKTLSETVKNTKTDDLFGSGKYRWWSDAHKRSSDVKEDESFYPVPASTAASQAGSFARQDESIQNTNDRFYAGLENRKKQQTIQFGNQIRTDYRLKKMFDQDVGLDAVNDLLSVVRTGNTVAAKALGMKTARGLGEVGVLTDTDVTKYVQSNQLARAAYDKLSQWSTGVPTDASLEELEEMIKIIQIGFNKKIQPIYNDYVERYAVNNQVPVSEAAMRLNVPYKAGVGLSGTTTAGSQTSGMTPEQYLQSINAKLTSANIEWAKTKIGGQP